MAENAFFIPVRLIVAKLIVGKHGINATQGVSNAVHGGNRAAAYPVNCASPSFYLYVLAADIMNERGGKRHVVGQGAARHLPATRAYAFAKPAV